MASAQGNGVVLVSQNSPNVDAQPLQQNTPIDVNDGWLQKFIKDEPKSLGIIQIMIGIIHICLGTSLSLTPYTNIAVISGVVFWAPLFFFASGGLSISAENNRNLYQVRGALAMNPLSAFGSVAGISICIVDIFLSESYYSTCKTSMEYNYECFTAQNLQNGILGVLSLLSLLELVISICTSVIGCKSVYGNSGSQAGQPVTVIQNTFPQDPQFQPMQSVGEIPIARGMPSVSQVLDIASTVQEMSTAYIEMITEEFQ